MPDPSRIPRNPAEWTLEHARSAVPAIAAEKGVGDGLHYLQGDHFQEGEPWVGPPGEKEEIRRRFVSVPELSARVSTRVNGACGFEANVSVEPRKPADTDPTTQEAIASDEQKREAAEWASDFGWWWTTKKFWGERDVAHPSGVRGVVAFGSSYPTGRSAIRVFFNPASRTQRAADGSLEVPLQPDRSTALRHINVGAPPPDRCAVYTDPDTHQKVGVFLYKDSEDRDAAEVWYAVEQGSRTFTALKTLVNGQTDADPILYPWDGFLPIQDAHVGCILSPSVRRLQGAADFGVTALHRNQEFHGYGLRTEINSEEDGDWRTTPPPGILSPRMQEVGGITHYFWPKDPTLSVRSIRRQVGFTYPTGTDPETGKETLGFTTPSVHYQDPSDPEAILKGIRADLSLIRDSCHQGHITDSLFGSTAEASGDAYEQKRADFKADIEGVAETVDGMVAPIATVVTLMADWLTGNNEPTFARDWEVNVQSHPSAGPASTQQQTTTLSLVEGDILSPEEGTARVGIQNVPAERDRIARSKALEAEARRIANVTAAISGGADAVWAWMHYGGLDEGEAKKATRSDGPPFTEQ